MRKTIKQKLTKRNDQGFTIIEVVLVLAIAGLIFLVVFLAVPQLQRSQRDSQRRSDAGRFMTSLETYASNNNGQYPAEGATGPFIDNYLERADSEFSDPSTGATYDMDTNTTVNTDAFGDDAIGKMFYRTGASCDEDEGTIDDSASDRTVAVLVPLENGIAYCQDNR